MAAHTFKDGVSMVVKLTGIYDHAILSLVFEGITQQEDHFSVNAHGYKVGDVYSAIICPTDELKPIELFCSFNIKGINIMRLSNGEYYSWGE